MTTELDVNTITFGKYKYKNLQVILKDRSYCKWLLKQEWFQNSYEYLFNRVKEYNPLDYFIKTPNDESKSFLNNYSFFNLIPVEDVKIELTEDEKKCYKYYLEMINQLKEKIQINTKGNIFDIKAPTRWLLKFEKKYELKRVVFKQFMSSYELPNIPYIIERIKKEGGLEYKGAQSFKIAKARSEEQEKWWDNVLKNKYGEDVGAQFKYEDCIFDFLNISTNTIFECKLGLKDFDEDQHVKYRLALKKYRIVYLISTDCVINMEQKCILTTNPKKYIKYLGKIPSLTDPSYLDGLIETFTIVELDDVSALFRK